MSINEPLVSILIPTFNSSKTIKRCIDSVTNQTYKNIEIIICDGGSKDITLDIIKNYDFITIINCKKGVSRQRNELLSNSKGDFVFFVDSDDYIDSDLIEKLLKATKLNDCDVASPSFKIFDENKIKPINSFNGICNFSQKNIFQSLIMPSPCKLYRRTFIIGTKFDNKLKYGEDLIFNLHLSTKNGKYISVFDTFYNYYHPTNDIFKYKTSGTTVFLKKLFKYRKNINDNEIFNIYFLFFKSKFDVYLKVLLQKHSFIHLLFLLKIRIFFAMHSKKSGFYLFPILTTIFKKLKFKIENIFDI